MIVDHDFTMIRIPFQNSYSSLPERFYTRTRPTPVRSPRLLRFNHELASELGIGFEKVSDETLAQIFSGNVLPEGADPIAMAYAGHQFGSFVPQLGDGRAILLGEVLDSEGERRDIQLKGAGRTPWSRGGDGRAALGPVLREYVVSEAMHALGIRTTRSLAAVVTGEFVFREAPLPGAIVTRVASSHIRVGTFEYFAVRRDVEAVRLLADHVIRRHFPRAADAENPYRALLDGVIEAQARLIASWLLVGLIHGVMNTDNMSIAGETIDYGPCAFLDEYDPAKVFSSIDRHGRYAFGNQPLIGGWNLARFAECLLPLFSEDAGKAVEEANEALSGFEGIFEQAYHAGLRRKLGFYEARDGDMVIANDFLAILHRAKSDFTLAFRALSAAAVGDEDELRRRIPSAEGVDDWIPRWRDRLATEPRSAEERRRLLDSVNPRYIPRNHRIEAMIRAAVFQNDFRLFEEMLAVLSKPFDDQPEMSRYAEPPAENERVLETFCGT